MTAPSMRTDKISFFGQSNAYREFSNFYPADITIDGKTYATNEVCLMTRGRCSGVNTNADRFNTTQHYFQSVKFGDDDYAEHIRTAPSMLEIIDNIFVIFITTRTAAAKAKALGGSRAIPIRGDWDTVRNDVMLMCVRAKFTQHAALTRLLLDTGDAELIEVI